VTNGLDKAAIASSIQTGFSRDIVPKQPPR
jgi:hypothetical protein